MKATNTMQTMLTVQTTQLIQVIQEHYDEVQKDHADHAPPCGQAVGTLPSGRYGSVPVAEIPLAAYPVRLSPNQGALLVEHVLGQSGAQPGPVLDWVMCQSNRYFEAFPKWSFQDQDHAAALDLLVWQRSDHIESTSRWSVAQEVIQFLEGLEDAVNNPKEIEQCQS